MTDNDQLSDFLDEPSSASVPDVKAGQSAAPADEASDTDSREIESPTPPTAAELRERSEARDRPDNKPLSKKEQAARAANKAATNRLKLAQENELKRGNDDTDTGRDEADDGEEKPKDDDEYDVEDPSMKKREKAEEAAPDPEAEAEAKLTARAKAAGLTDQQIKDFGEDLETIVDRAEARKAPPTPPATPPAAPPTSPKPGEPAAPKAADSSNEDIYAKMEADGYDKTLIDTLRQRDAAINQRFAAFDAQTQEVQRARLEQQFEKAFTALPENFRELFGTGATDAMPNDSSSRLARIETVQEYVRLATGYEALGEKIPPMVTLLERAARSVFGKTLAAQEAQALLTKLKPRQSRFTNPPTSRRAAPREQTPDERSLASIERILDGAEAR